MLTLDIGIPTAGRAEIVSETVNYLKSDLKVSVPIWVSVGKEEDCNSNEMFAHRGVDVIKAPLGLCSQRNRIMSASNADVILFIDDDFLIDRAYIRECVRIFEENEDVALVTGSVLADGAVGPGLGFNEAKTIISSIKNFDDPKGTVAPVYNGYGCNMAVRLSVCKEHNVWFDETLPLYAWLEDVDFSRRLAKFGRIVKSTALKGVHLGTKRSGRTPGKRLGYTQIANPIYLSSKGSVSWRVSLKLMSRNMIANTVRSFRPEPWVDRRGRLKGNLLAIYDLLRGKLSPANIVDM